MSKRSERRNKARTKVVKKEDSKPAQSQKLKKNFLDKNYKTFIIIPLIILLVAILQIGYQGFTTGDFINKGVSLAGGSSIYVQKDFIANDVESSLSEQYPDFDINVRELTRAGQSSGFVIETIAIEKADTDMIISSLNANFGEVTADDYAVEKISATLGNQFFKQTFIALILAFVLMGVVVFFYFRTFIPSVAVILSAFSDIVVTAAIVNFMGIRLSTAGVAAFLMLIGYSVDTDILLSTKMLKSKGRLFGRYMEAFKTGGTMTLTTILAVTVALIFTESVVIKQIVTIVLIGLLVYVMNTWILNAGILRWYVEKTKGDKHE